MALLTVSARRPGGLPAKRRGLRRSAGVLSFWHLPFPRRRSPVRFALSLQGKSVNLHRSIHGDEQIPAAIDHLCFQKPAVLRGDIHRSLSGLDLKAPAVDQVCRIEGRTAELLVALVPEYLDLFLRCPGFRQDGSNSPWLMDGGSGSRLSLWISSRSRSCSWIACTTSTLHVSPRDSANAVSKARR